MIVIGLKYHETTHNINNFDISTSNIIKNFAIGVFHKLEEVFKDLEAKSKLFQSLRTCFFLVVCFQTFLLLLQISGKCF